MQHTPLLSGQQGFGALIVSITTPPFLFFFVLLTLEYSLGVVVCGRTPIGVIARGVVDTDMGVWCSEREMRGGGGGGGWDGWFRSWYVWSI